MLYELTTLSCPLLSLAEAAEGVRAWTFDAEAAGDVLALQLLLTPIAVGSSASTSV